MYRSFEHLINTLKYSADMNTINLYKSYLTTNNTYVSDYEISFVVYSENQLDLSSKKSNSLSFSQVVRTNHTVCERLNKILSRLLPFWSTN
jgi:hypothetical protein